MKILLLGDFSGFFLNLKKGFEVLGHEVVLMSSGDGWKKIPGADVSFPTHKNNFLRRVILFFSLLFYSRRMRGFDVVLIINPNFFKKGLVSFLLKNLKKYNKKIFLSACGDDYEYINFGEKGGFDYWPYSPDAEGKEVKKPIFDQKVHHVIADSVDGIIPVFYDYAEAWRHSIYSDKVRKTIPLPIFVPDDDQVISESNSKKIKIIHGLNRPGFKGGDFIAKAMIKIKDKYPDDVCVYIYEPVEFSRYQEILNSADVVVDQCKFNSGPAMNSLNSMVRGKVVLAGQTIKSLEEYEIENSPIVSIKPDVDSIFNELENLIFNKDALHILRRKSVDFVKKNNDAIIVAEKYIDIFEADF